MEINWKIQFRNKEIKLSIGEAWIIQMLELAD